MKVSLKVILSGSLGAIVLGVIGNAIWEAIKPLSVILFKGLLNLSIFGFDKFKNNIYIEVAKGLHEGPSMEIYELVWSCIIALFLASIFSFIKLHSKLRKKEELKERTSQAENKLDSLIKRNGFMWVILLYAIFCLTIFSLDLVKIIYINGAVTHFEQALAIISPNITEQENKEFRSDFAQIKSRDDYIMIINRMNLKAQEAGKQLPQVNLIF